MSESFVEIGARYDSDKGTYHRYYEVYDSLLTRHRKTAGNMLELGVYRGESMKVWVDAFPKKKIYGIDAHLHPGLELSDTWTFHQDDAYQSAALAWAETYGPFDVIIDDGPHLWEPQAYVVQNYSRLLSRNGTLIIEDIGIPEWVGRLAKLIPSELQYQTFGVDRRIVPGSAGEDLMLVIDKAP